MPIDKSMENNPPLTPDQIPPSFTRCFDEKCPHAAACSRYLAGRFIPEGWTTGPAVYPTARQGDRCALFRPTRVIRAAYGFDKLFEEVKHKHTSLLRRRVKSYLGGNSAYYRFHHGERMLTPEQQERIIALFRSYGYTEELRFDHYRELYDFL